MSHNLDSTILHVHFFFIDMVGISDPKMSTKTQIKKISELNKCISDCETYKNESKENMIPISTGDGMAIGFLQGLEKPLNLAVELHEKLAEYNKSIIPSETIRVRIGLNNGNVFVIKDIHGNKIFWGPGLIIARRIMDIGEDDHILLGPIMAEDLREYSDEYKKIVKPVHDFNIKHNQTLLIYSAYGKNFGNSSIPTKGIAEKSKMVEEISKLKKSTLYPSIWTSIYVINSEKMIVRHKRVYEIFNKSDEPIHYVLHGIALDLEKPSLDSLNVKVYDEDNSEMKISSINLDRPYQKEFSTKFNNPILKDQKNRKYTLEYEVEEPKRFYENNFAIENGKFAIEFDYPDDKIIKDPIIYEVNNETDEKIKSDTQPTIENHDGRKIAKWHQLDINQGQTFRIEW